MGIEPRASHMLVKDTTTELSPMPRLIICFFLFPQTWLVFLLTVMYIWKEGGREGTIAVSDSHITKALEVCSDLKCYIVIILKKMLGTYN